MRRHALLPALLFCFSTLLPASTLPELFQKAKEQFRFGEYAGALSTLQTLEAESQKPGNESLRTAVLPGLVFYRGACLAALGKAGEAQSDFEVFLTYKPNASLDPAIYPKTVIRALEDARRALQKKGAAPQETGSMAAAYRAFPREVSPRDLDPGEDWGSGPVKYLMTPKERQRWEHLSDSVSRSEFITSFWKARDPRPETPENEFREEFEKRVAFADAKLAQDETRGSLTDRGMVFVLLGPPTYVGRMPLTTGQDTADPLGMSRYSRQDIAAAQLGKSPIEAAAVVDRMTGPSNTLPGADANWRELWHYRRELLPRGVPYQQVDFEFVTRRGYGKNVLQRDSAALATLEAALKERR